MNSDAIRVTAGTPAAVSDAIRVTRLPSGLTVVTERMDRVETVSLGAYVGAGTRHERAEENGVSHFLEHMAFKGTARRSAAAIAEEIENVGGHINAYTAREQTAYYVKLLREDLALGADIVGDILSHSIFAPDELERERGVILQEIGQANDTPDDIIFDHFQETAFPAQPMGRPVLGTEAVIRALTRERLTGYMRAHYAAGNVVLAAAGALEHEDVLDLARRHFADLPAEMPAPAVPGRYQGGEFREERELDQVHIVLGFPAVSYADPDYYPALLLSTLLGGGMSSRLFQEVREKRGLVYSIYSFNAPHADGGLFGIYAGTGEREAEELVPVTLEELRKVQRGVSEAELARARAQVKASLLMSLESTGARCEQLARQLQVFGRVVPTAETVAKINAVTIDGVCRAAARIFRARRPWRPSGRPSMSPGCRRSPTGWPPEAPMRDAPELLPALLDAARAAGADAADAVLIAGTSLGVQRRLGQTEHVERAESRDLGLRVFVGKRAAIVSSSVLDPAGFAALAERAVAMARVVPEDPFSGLAEAMAPAADAAPLDLDDPDEPDVAALLDRAAAAEDAVLSMPGITNTEGAEAGFGRTEIALATSAGFFGSYRRTSHSVAATALAGQGTGMQRDYDYATVVHAADLEDPAAIGRRAAERALARLDPARPATAVVPVVYDPRVAGSLLGHLLGAINGAAVARGTSFLRERMGSRIFASGITVRDDPHRVRGLRSAPFDGEGVPTAARDLIADGVLTTWLLDARSARQLGLRSTGHAGRGTGGPPSPGPSNVHLDRDRSARQG